MKKKRMCLFFVGCEDEKNGIHEYNQNLLKGISSIEDDVEIDLVLARHSEKFYEHFCAPNLKKVFFPSFINSALKELLWSNVFYFFNKHRYKFFVVTSVGRVPFFSSGNTVSVVHDLAIFKNENNFGRLRHFYNKYIVPFVFKSVRHLVCISDYTKRDLNDLTKSRFAPKIKTIPSGYFPIENNENLPRHMNESYLFYCARIEHPKKNHLNLCLAFNELRKSGKYGGKLVFAGKPDRGSDILMQEIEKLEYRSDVLFLGYQERSVLLSLYKHADAIVIPSLDEGFCFPVLEGLNLNGNVVGANSGAIPETGGSLVKLFDPNDYGSIAEVLERAVKEGPARPDLVTDWLENFKWEKTAEKILNLRKVA